MSYNYQTTIELFQMTSELNKAFVWSNIKSAYLNGRALKHKLKDFDAPERPEIQIALKLFDAAANSHVVISGLKKVHKAIKSKAIAPPSWANSLIDISKYSKNRQMSPHDAWTPLLREVLNQFDEMEDFMEAGPIGGSKIKAFFIKTMTARQIAAELSKIKLPTAELSNEGWTSLEDYQSRDIKGLHPKSASDHPQFTNSTTYFSETTKTCRQEKKPLPANFFSILFEKIEWELKIGIFSELQREYLKTQISQEEFSECLPKQFLAIQTLLNKTERSLESSIELIKLAAHSSAVYNFVTFDSPLLKTIELGKNIPYIIKENRWEDRILEKAFEKYTIQIAKLSQKSLIYLDAITKARDCVTLPTSLEEFHSSKKQKTSTEGGSRESARV